MTDLEWQTQKCILSTQAASYLGPRSFPTHQASASVPPCSSFDPFEKVARANRMPGAMPAPKAMQSPPIRWTVDLSLVNTFLMASKRANEYAGDVVVVLLILGIVAVPGVWLYALSFIVPTWLLGAGVFATFIYYFEYLPFQHYWNPSVRELYPHRQWAIEQATMQFLHRNQIIPSSRLTKQPHRIPLEVWSRILDHVIDIPFFFDTACDSNNFNLFIYRQTPMKNSLGYTASEKERRSLRLVCKRWNPLLQQHTMRFVSSNHQWSASGTSLTRVEFTVGSPSPSVASMTPDALAESIAAAREQAASLRVLCVIGGDVIASTSVFEFFREHIVRRAEKFPSLQSLILSGDSSVPVGCLMDIQRSFSHLTFLHLEGETAYGPLNLEKLDILHLNVTPDSVQEWHFPSLRHLSIGENYLRDNNLDLGIIPAATDRLHSLLLPVTHATVHMDQAFWSRLSSLQFLGISLRSFTIIDNPPPKHPLRHLCLTEAFSDKTLGKSKVDIKDLNSERFTDATARLPSLEVVTMPTVLDARMDRYPAELKAVFRVNRSRGLIWVDEFGNRIDPLKRIKERRKFGWEEHVDTAVLLYCGLITLILTKLFRLTDDATLLLCSPALIGIVAYWVWAWYELLKP